MGTLSKSVANTFRFIAPHRRYTVQRFKSSGRRRVEKVDEVTDDPVFQYPVPSPDRRRVYAWGVAETGALGHYTSKLRREMKSLAEYHHRPVRIHFSELFEVDDIACGYGFTVYAVKPEKGKKQYRVFGTGVNTDSQIGYHSPRPNAPLGLLLNPAPINIPLKHSDTTVIGLAAGRAHLLVLTDKEGVFTLGNNAYGQCGRPVIEDENYVGSRVVHNIENIDGVKICYVACGQDHSMLITERGEVFAFGWGADGQTGQGHYDSDWKPRRVKGDIEGEKIVKVASSADCVLAVNNQGEVFGWGNSEYGQLGTDMLQLNTAKHLASCRSVGKIVDVAAGGSFCMILNEDGQVFVWGYGILGKGPSMNRCLEPSEIPPVLFGQNEFQQDCRVRTISCGLSHLMAVTNHGDLYAWGHNKGGCLGLGHSDDQFFPFKVAVGASVVKVCCGVDHTVAMCKPY